MSRTALLPASRLAEAVRTRSELHGEAFNFSNEIQFTVLDLTRKILDAMTASSETVASQTLEAYRRVVDSRDGSVRSTRAEHRQAR